MKKRSILLACLILTGCHNPTPDTTLPPPDPNQVIKLGINPDEKPPWFKDDMSINLANLPSFGQPYIIALGKQRSIHKTQMGLFILHKTLGIERRLTLPPDAIWVGLDDRDALWIGEKSGLLTIKHKDTIKTKSIKNTRSWDVAGRFAVALTNKSVFISKNNGLHWQNKPLPPKLDARQIYVRHDGIIAIFGLEENKRTTYLSSNQGGTWVRSIFQPQNLKRHGAWLWNADPNCVAVLSQDGKTWSADPSLVGLPGWKDPRNDMLSIRFVSHAVSRRKMHNSLTMPPAVPGPNMQHTNNGKTRDCKDPIPDAKSLTSTHKNTDRGPQPTPCQGAYCLHDAKTPPLSTSAYFRSIVPTSKESKSTQLLIVDVDHNTIQAQTLTHSCKKARVFNAAALGVLLCEQTQNSTHIFTSAHNAPWTLEHVVNASSDTIEGLAMGKDGTLVLRGLCRRGGTCHPSLVRQPKPTKNQWYTIKQPRVAMVVPLFEGKALIAQTKSTTTTALMLSVVGPKTSSFLTTVSPLTQHVRQLDVHATGHIQLYLGDEFRAKPQWITYGGKLVDPTTR